MTAMSDSGLPGSGGNDPFGDDNPFKGMPIFGDLAKLFQQQGPVNWDAARQLAFSIAVGETSEPNVDPLDRIKIEQLTRVADLQVANATGLTTSITGRGITIVPVTRSQWAQQALDAYRPLFEQLAGSLHQDDVPTIDGRERIRRNDGDPALTESHVVADQDTLIHPSPQRERDGFALMGEEFREDRLVHSRDGRRHERRVVQRDLDEIRLDRRSRKHLHRAVDVRHRE